MIISTYLRRLQGAGVHVGCDMCPRSNMCPTKSLLTPETQFPFLPLCAWRTSPRPQACRIPGPPASFPPHLPTLILPASPQNSGCISQTLLAWTELSSSTEKVHLLLCRLGSRPTNFPALGFWAALDVAANLQEYCLVVPILQPGFPPQSTQCPVCMAVHVLLLK